MAIRGSRAIGSDDALSGNIDLNGHVEVTDARGDLLVTIPFSAAVSVPAQPWPGRKH